MGFASRTFATSRSTASPSPLGRTSSAGFVTAGGCAAGAPGHALIFVTAHDQYAIRAFEIAAIDYLLKPVAAERFALAFRRAVGRLRGVPGEEGTQQVLAMLDAVAHPPRQLERFAVRSGERTVFAPVDDVEWIEAFQNYVRLHAGSSTHLLHVPMNTIEAVLDPARFLRIHRSHIVNVRRIAQLWSVAHGQFAIELKSGQRLQSGALTGSDPPRTVEPLLMSLSGSSRTARR